MRPSTLVLQLLSVVLIALPVGAQVTATDFREYTKPITTEYQAAIGAPLTSGGLDFYNATEFSATGSSNSLGTWGTDDEGQVNRPSNLMGGNSLFATSLGSEIDIVLAGSDIIFGPLGSFGIQSIDFAHLYSDAYTQGFFTLAPISLRIFGANSRNETFFQDFVFPVSAVDASGFRRPRLNRAFLNSRFSDVNNIFFNQSTGSGRAFQFTNVIPTPEPASFVLLGTGLLGVFGITARSRRNKSTGNA